jgi:hypothetical protein
MRVVVLTDVARFRLQSISFFLLALLVFALVVRVLWNWLRKDFTRLPRLSYPRALGLLTLWGLLFVIVLAMISGARELMTPGAWIKQPNGGYKLAAEPGSEQVRRAALGHLQAALWAYADVHDNHLPDAIGTADPLLPADVWRTPHESGAQYAYVPGQTRGPHDALIAYEPGLWGEGCYVLLSSGRIESWPLSRIVASARPEGTP